MIGERIKRARSLAGLSLRALGGQVSLSQTAVQKFEKGELTPSSSDLLKLAKATGVKVEYFFRSSQVSLRNVEFRKKSTFGQKAREAAQAELAEQVERRAEVMSFFPVSPMPTFRLPLDLPERVTTLDGVEGVAQAMRHAWDLGQDPIADMIDTLENGGVWAFVLRGGADGKLNGISALADETPVVAVTADVPGDRQRFTLAHELGHLVLSDRLAPDLDEEKACHRFAGAFLLPKPALLREIGPHRRRLEWRELTSLKQQFGISMAASMVRAHQLDIITDRTYQSMRIELGVKKWHLQEPIQTRSEETHVFEQLVFRALAEDLIGEAKAAELLGMNLVTFQSFRMLRAPDADAPHQ